MDGEEITEHPFINTQFIMSHAATLTGTTAIANQIDVAPSKARPALVVNAARRGLRTTPTPISTPQPKPVEPTPSSRATWVNARFPPQMKVVNEALNNKMDKLIRVISKNTAAILKLANHVTVSSGTKSGTAGMGTFMNFSVLSVHQDINEE